MSNSVSNRSMSVKARIVMIAGMIMVMLAAFTLIASADENEQPCVMTVDGKAVMLVESEEAGMNALEEAIKVFVPKGTTLRSVSYDEVIAFVNADTLFNVSENAGTEDAGMLKAAAKGVDLTDGLMTLGGILNETDAEALLKQALSGKDPLLTVNMIVDKFKTKDIEQKVTFKYKKSMRIYDFKVKSKGKKGKKKTRYEWSVKNGEVVEKTKKETTTTKKAKNAVVYTGYKKASKKVKWSDYKEYKKEIKKQFGNTALGENVVEYGKRFLGNPYKYGGKSLTNGIDCVQFIRAVYKKYGIDLPGNKKKFYQVGHKVSLNEARAGDIVYYGSHVALYMGNGKVIHAQYKGISISNVHYRGISFIRRVK
ncbi:MAG: C40 family peptidase [Clostridia bacterium]|nr:C40 family peptidase [Clostridia bacterium]